jgi:cysteine desulfurase
VSKIRGQAPITELARIAHQHGALFHTDAAQAVGKIPVDVNALGVDLLTLVGHKMYAPKGVAALYVRAGTRLEPLIHGGGQEHGLRAGTENVALIVALGAAANLAAADLAAGEPDRLRRLRDDLHHRLAEQLPGRVLLNGHPTHRLPNTANLALLPHRGDDILAAAPNIAASTGSACHTGTAQPSPVLTAMAAGMRPTAQPHERARSALRLSLGRWTTLDDIAQAATQLVGAAT